ncbi:MAG: tetratricopeptide repeat protein [Puniceicoccaceae bacterium]
MKLTSLLTLIGLFLLSFSPVFSAPSKPSKPSVPREEGFFISGTEMLYQEKYQAAERDLRRALRARETFAEAHNNLAFVLRKQGEDFYAEALNHYNRAVELNPKLAEAYMYRGVLHVAMGNQNLALADHQKLLELEQDALASELEYVITNGQEKDPAQFFGVVASLKK